MKKLITLIVLFLLNQLFAAETITIEPAQFEIQTMNGLDKLDYTLKNPESLLTRFQPEGAQISKKYVSKNVVSFFGTKSWLGLSRSIFVKGSLDSNLNSLGCNETQLRYDVTFNFEGSDGLVADNYEMIKIKICASETSSKNLTLKIYPSLVQSENYSNFTGSYVKRIIQAQINPIIKAINQEITSR